MPVTRKRTRSLAIAVMMGALAFGISACQFQPLYSSDAGTVGNQNLALSRISVAEVGSRAGQQVRNHLIFLLSGGSSPVDPSHEVRIRVTSTTTVLAGAIAGAIETGNARRNPSGNTAGSVQVTASYDLYDIAAERVIATGTRTTNAPFDRKSQSFAAQRAERDAESRAAREIAEQLRLAIGSDVSRL